jgi:hypothetical protein
VIETTTEPQTQLRRYFITFLSEFGHEPSYANGFLCGVLSGWTKAIKPAVLAVTYRTIIRTLQN